MKGALAPFFLEASHVHQWIFVCEKVTVQVSVGYFRPERRFRAFQAALWVARTLGSRVNRSTPPSFSPAHHRGPILIIAVDPVLEFPQDMRGAEGLRGPWDGEVRPPMIVHVHACGYRSRPCV